MAAGRPIYIGHPFQSDGDDCVWRDGQDVTFAHGGAGIVLSAAAAAAVAQRTVSCISRFGNCWAGDTQVALCLRDANVTFGEAGLEREEQHFRHEAPSRALGRGKKVKWVWRTGRGVTPITFHAVESGEQAAISRVERELAKKGERVTYSALREYLVAHGIVRKKTGKKAEGGA